MNEISRFDVDLRTNLLKSSVDERVLGVESINETIIIFNEERIRAFIFSSKLRRNSRNACGHEDPVRSFTRGRVA